MTHNLRGILIIILTPNDPIRLVRHLDRYVKMLEDLINIIFPTHSL